MRFEQLYPKRNKERQERERKEREPLDAKFSEDWKRPTEIETKLGEKMNVYDMRPKHEKTPIPVTMVGGWTADAEAWKKNMREFVSRGRRAIMTDTPHGVEYRPEDLKLDKRATDIEYRKITALFAGLDAAGVEKTDAVAHSEGCIDLLIAALSYPERFHNLVLVEPAGMIGEDGFIRLVLRNQLGDVPDMKKAHKARERGDPEYTFDVNPADSTDIDTFSRNTQTWQDKWLTFKALLSISHIQVVDLLRTVKKLGIGIVIIQGAESKMFPMELMTGTVKRDAAGNIAFRDDGHPIMEKRGAIGNEKRPEEQDYSNIVDGFYSIKGVHVRWFDQPVQCTQLAEGALTALEAKQTNK